jgi:hypothetical protein
MQFTYNVMLRCVRELLLCGKAVSITYWSVCACVHMGTQARGHVHVALLIQHATHMHHTVMSFVAPWSPTHFSELSHK